MPIARSISSVLREMDLVESSKRLSAAQKVAALGQLQLELDELAGQPQLPGVAASTEAPAALGSQVAPDRKAK